MRPYGHDELRDTPLHPVPAQHDGTGDNPLLGCVGRLPRVMSAASDALLGRLFAEGALPAQAPPLAAGELRVAGATLSSGAAQLYTREKGRWLRGCSATMGIGKWLRPCATELPAGVEIEPLRKQVAHLFGIPEVRRRRRGACAPGAALADASCAARYEQPLRRGARGAASAASRRGFCNCAGRRPRGAARAGACARS